MTARRAAGAVARRGGRRGAAPLPAPNATRSPPRTRSARSAAMARPGRASRGIRVCWARSAPPPRAPPLEAAARCAVRELGGLQARVRSGARMTGPRRAGRAAQGRGRERAGRHAAGPLALHACGRPQGTVGPLAFHAPTPLAAAATPPAAKASLAPWRPLPSAPISASTGGLLSLYTAQQGAVSAGDSEARHSDTRRSHGALGVQGRCSVGGRHSRPTDRRARGLAWDAAHVNRPLGEAGAAGGRRPPRRWAQPRRRRGTALEARRAA
jgi:hypothetical protein